MTMLSQRQMLQDAEVKATILYHLRRKKVIGGVHTPFDTVTKGFPAHLGKDIKKIAESLIREGLLITKSASYGLQISLNKERLPEIDGIIQRVLGSKI